MEWDSLDDGVSVLFRGSIVEMAQVPIGNLQILRAVTCSPEQVPGLHPVGDWEPPFVAREPRANGIRGADLFRSQMTKREKFRLQDPVVCGDLRGFLEERADA